MHITNFTESKFLRKADVEPPVLVTMSELEQVNVSMPGEPAELKWALHFAELEKPLIMNSTNAELIKKITGSEDTDDWIGTKSSCTRTITCHLAASLLAAFARVRRKNR